MPQRVVSLTWIFLHCFYAVAEEVHLEL